MCYISLKRFFCRTVAHCCIKNSKMVEKSHVKIVFFFTTMVSIYHGLLYSFFKYGIILLIFHTKSWIVKVNIPHYSDSYNIVTFIYDIFIYKQLYGILL